MKKILFLFLIGLSSIGFSQSFSLKINNTCGTTSPLNCTYQIKVAVTAHKSGSVDEGMVMRDPVSIAPGANHTFTYTFSAGYTVDYSTLAVTVVLGGSCTNPVFNASGSTKQGNCVTCTDVNEVSIWDVVTTDSEYNIHADDIVH